MVKKLARWFLPILIAILVILIFTSPVLASIPQPDTLQILNVQAYQNAKEDGDQLYIISYHIDFNIAESEEYPNPINELFIFRLLNSSGSEVTSAEAYPFYNQGYGRGIVAFYLSATEAPPWGGAISVEVAGNPLVDWEGVPPSTKTTAVTWTTNTQSEIRKILSGKILYHASQLEQIWEVEMTMVSSGTTILSETGAMYFLRVIPHLKEVAPYVLGQYVFTPEYPLDKPTEDTYASRLEEMIRGTIFDLSPTARSWGISRGALTAILYYGFVAALLGLLLFKKGIKKGLLLLAWPLVIGGAFIGVPLVVTIICAFICFVSTVLATVYRHST